MIHFRKSIKDKLVPILNEKETFEDDKGKRTIRVLHMGDFHQGPNSMFFTRRSPLGPLNLFGKRSIKEASKSDTSIVQNGRRFFVRLRPFENFDMIASWTLRTLQNFEKIVSNVFRGADQDDLNGRTKCGTRCAQLFHRLSSSFLGHCVCMTQPS